MTDTILPTRPLGRIEWQTVGPFTYGEDGKGNVFRIVDDTTAAPNGRSRRAARIRQILFAKVGK